MARYIDAELLEKAIDEAQTSLETNDDKMWEINKPYYKGLCWARGLLNDQPTADVVEVKRGCWKDRYNNKYYNHLYACSVCNKEALCEHYTNELGQIKVRQALTPLCPHCGAKMDGERKEER